MEPVVVIDNGSNAIRVGFSGKPNSLRVYGNYIAKSKTEKKFFIGGVGLAKDKLGLQFRRPFDRGYLISWDTEKEIWDAVFSGFVKPDSSHLLLSEPLFNPGSVRKVQNEILFEEFGFLSLYNCSAPVMTRWNPDLSNTRNMHILDSSNCGDRDYDKSIDAPFECLPIQNSNNLCFLIVDTGYSFSNIVPFFDNYKINYAIKRVNIGGKALTNYLKEIVSYRHWNVMEESYLMNVIKEKLCYVSLDFSKEMELTNRKDSLNTIQCDYVLPDYVNIQEGYIKEKSANPISISASTSEEKHENSDNQPTMMRMETMPITSASNSSAHPGKEEQVLHMNNERITVPELLFNPSYIGRYFYQCVRFDSQFVSLGINQAGIAEAIVQSVEACHPDMHGLLYQNIVLTGGNVCFENFSERLYRDLRCLVPSEFSIRIYTPDE